MRVIMDIHIVTRNSTYTHMMKEIETTATPIPGIPIEDPAWHDPRQPASIVCNFQESCYALTFSWEEVSSEEAAERGAKMYVAHGWKDLGGRIKAGN